MRFNEFVNETSGKKTPLYKIIQEINKNCQPFLKEWSKMPKPLMFLYSGRNPYKDMFRKKIRTDRYPKDTPEGLQDKLDESFYRKFKVKPRSNSIFCSGRHTTAGGYGNHVYLIFPVGKYTPIWSGEISDLYVEMDENTEISAMFNAQEGYGYSGDSRDIPDIKIEEWSEDYWNTSNDYEEEYGPDTQGGYWEYVDQENNNYLNEFAPGTTKEEATDELFYQHDTTYNPDAPEPIDNYSVASWEGWVWTPSVDEDEYHDDRMRQYLDDRAEEWMEEAPARLDEEIENLVDRYEKDRIIHALKSDNEIMIVGKEYIAVNDIYEDDLREWYQADKKHISAGDPRQLNLFDWVPDKKKQKKVRRR